MISMISFILSFEINKTNRFPALTAPFHLFFSNLFAEFEANLLTNLSKLSLAKRIATFVNALFA